MTKSAPRALLGVSPRREKCGPLPSTWGNLPNNDFFQSINGNSQPESGLPCSHGKCHDWLMAIVCKKQSNSQPAPAFLRCHHTTHGREYCDMGGTEAQPHSIPWAQDLDSEDPSHLVQPSTVYRELFSCLILIHPSS